MIELRCSNCGKRIKVSESHAGKKGKCPKCKNVVTVPQIEKSVRFICPIAEFDAGMTIGCTYRFG